jgi:hypothetical protein
MGELILSTRFDRKWIEGLTDAVISVFTYPGEMELTRMPCFKSAILFNLVEVVVLSHIFRQFLCDGRTHRSDCAFRSTVRRAELTAHCDMAGHTGDQNNTAVLCPIRDHLFRCKLCGEIKS